MNEQQAEAQSERIAWDGRELTATWLDPPFRPERRLTTQVLGLCFTQEGQIALVGVADDGWTLPGGHPEPGESLEETLERALRDDLSARLVSCQYIGCQRVDDPDRPDGPALYYQARFWARVELYPFETAADAVARRLVRPEQFCDTLLWGDTVTARALLAAGLRREQSRAHSAS